MDALQTLLERQAIQDTLTRYAYGLDSYQPELLLSNFVIEIDGDTARSRTECFNPLQGRDENDELVTVKAGCHYLDELVKRNGQWRIRKRYLVVTWME